MIKIVADFYVKEEKVDQFISLASELVEASRKEEGCISYHLYEDLDEPAHLAFIEEWKDAEAISIHNSSKHFTSAVPKLGELCVKEAVIKKYKEAGLK